MTEELTEADLNDLIRGAECAEQDWNNGQPYASFHSWCSESYREGYALYLRLWRYTPGFTMH